MTMDQKLAWILDRVGAKPWECVRLPRVRLKVPLTITTEEEARAWLESPEALRRQQRNFERSANRMIYNLKRAERDGWPRPRRCRR